MQWHSNSLGGDHRYAWITVNGSSRARDQQDFIFAAPCRCPSFRADCPLATKPNAMPILDERSLPPERGGRTNRAAKLEMIACSEEKQFRPPRAGLFSLPSARLAERTSSTTPLLRQRPRSGN